MPDAAPYKVTLDNYYGPLDLLLHLVKESELDITAVALSRVCEQYIQFLTAMERLDIDLSSGFLTMASQLLLIKSRTLAPPEAAPAEDGEPPPEDEEDASLELIKKLLEYKRFKDRARALDALAQERAARFGRPRIRLEGETEHEPLRNLELWDLVLLYSKVIKGTRLEAMMSILYRDVPLELFVEKILQSLASRRRANFSELVGERPDRTQILGTFLALLQLAKAQKVTLEQDVDHGDIRVEAKDAPAPAEPPPDGSAGPRPAPEPTASA